MSYIKTLTVNGSRYTVRDPEAARTDDSAIGTDTWSSKNTVDKLCPSFSKSGWAAACEPVAGYPLQVVTQLSASEDGYTGIAMRHFGENLLIGTPQTATTNGVTFTVNDDGSITANGTATGEVYYELGRTRRIAGKEYVLTGTPKGGSSSTYCMYASNGDNKFVYDTGESVTFTSATSSNNLVRILIRTGTTVSELVFRPVFYLTADSKIFSEDFGKTVYGGSYDWNTGTLTDENGEQTQLTPQAVTALPGTNTLYTDAGEVTVTGRADPTAVIEKLTNAILALGGNV